MDNARDLGQVDLWQESLERSLARRGRPKRSSVALFQLHPERDLTLEDVLRESVQYSQLRRHVAANPLASRPTVAVGGVSALALLAATTLPGLLGGRGGVRRERIAYAASRTAVAVHGVSDTAVQPRALPVAVQTPAARPRPRSSRATPVESIPAAVLRLQQRLGLSPDGTFGPLTLKAVKAFQAAHGLFVDGVVGPQTWAALGLRAGPTLRATLLPAPVAPARPKVTHTVPAATLVKTTKPAPPKPQATVRHPHPTTTPTTHPKPRPAAPKHTSTPTSGGLPVAVQEMIAAANQIATRPYVYGGGHASFNSWGYDCSGSVSYVLHGAGLLSSPLDSTGLESYGAPGPGRWVTIYANAGHAWMVIDGRRFDTAAMYATGSRWSSTMASTAGYVVRHPAGL